MTSNPLLVQLLQFYSVVYAVIKPAVVVYVIVAFFMCQEKNSGSIEQQVKGVLYYILQSVAFALLSFGAIPPIVAVISGQQMQAEWYVTFLFTFSSGGLLFLWVDNKIRLLPLHAYKFTKMLYLHCIQIIGTLCIAFTLVSIAMATLYGQIQNPGWWAVPLCTIVYGFLLTWLTAETKPNFVLASNPNESSFSKRMKQMLTSESKATASITRANTKSTSTKRVARSTKVSATKKPTKKRSANKNTK